MAKEQVIEKNKDEKQVEQTPLMTVWLPPSCKVREDGDKTIFKLEKESIYSEFEFSYPSKLVHNGIKEEKEWLNLAMARDFKLNITKGEEKKQINVFELMKRNQNKQDESGLQERLLIKSQVSGWKDWFTDEIKNNEARKAAEWLITNNYENENDVKSAFYSRQTSNMSDDFNAEEKDETAIIRVAKEYKNKQSAEQVGQVKQDINTKENIKTKQEIEPTTVFKETEKAVLIKVGSMKDDVPQSATWLPKGAVDLDKSGKKVIAVDESFIKKNLLDVKPVNVKTKQK